MNTSLSGARPDTGGRGPCEEMPCLANPSRILLWRPDHLGDLVIYSGALRHIRKRWPRAHITLGVHPYGRALFAHCPYVDAFFPCEELPAPLGGVPLYPGIDMVSQLWRRVWNLFPGSPYRKYHEALSCDVVIFPLISPNRRDHIVMDLLPGRAKIGVSGSRNNQAAITDAATRGYYAAQMDVSMFPKNHPEMELNRRFLSFLGIEAGADELWPEFWTEAGDAEKARKLMGEGGGLRVLGVAPGVSFPRGKQLAAEWYARCLREVGLRDFRVVLLGSKADVGICEELAGLLVKEPNIGGVLNVAGQTSILELVECIRLCDAMICPDAAPLHIATALRKPVAGIMGGRHFGQFYPWGDADTARLVHKRMDCYGCNWHCRYETMRCIQEIGPEEGSRVLTELIAALPKRESAV